MGYFTIGLLLGIVVMACICELAHHDEVSDLENKITQDRQYHFDAIQQLEHELKIQRNVSKSLCESVNRLRRENEKLKKNEANNNCL